MNGMDIKEWDPSTDKFLDTRFDANSMAEGKAAAKATLQRELGLAVSSRLLHILLDAHCHMCIALHSLPYLSYLHHLAFPPYQGAQLHVNHIWYCICHPANEACANQ